jgi:hypothetical protein
MTYWTADTPVVACPQNVVVACDYLAQRGGAERVVLSMLRAFPAAIVRARFLRAAY